MIAVAKRIHTEALKSVGPVAAFLNPANERVSIVKRDTEAFVDAIALQPENLVGVYESGIKVSDILDDLKAHSASLAA